MAAKRNRIDTLLKRLAKRPHYPDLVVEGGKRTLGVYYREDRDIFQPYLALWVEAETGFIRHSTVINPRESADEGVTETVEALLTALMEPMPNLTPASVLGSGAPPQQPVYGRPSRVLVNDEAVARAVSELLAPLDVTVEQRDELPTFDAAFADLSNMMGADESAGPPEPFSWDLDAALVGPLYKAALTFARREPWTLLPNDPPLAVTLGADGPREDTETLYASIMGAGGQVYGVAFYYSLEDFGQAAQQGLDISEVDEQADAFLGMLQQAGFPLGDLAPEEARDALRPLLLEAGAGGAPGLLEAGTADAPGADAAMAPQMPELQESIALTFDPKEDTDPTYLDWLAAHGITRFSRWGVPYFMRTSPGQEPGLPDEREARAVTLALQALDQAMKDFDPALAGPIFAGETFSYVAEIGRGAEARAIEVAVPPPGYVSPVAPIVPMDEALAPASEAGPTTLYRFKVALDGRRSVWRRIEMRGDQSLDDLHGAIQDAFEWDDDHLYAFFLSGRAWDEETAYESPYGEGRSAAAYRLEQLSLVQGQSFLYIFDFGDELRHVVTVEAVVPDGVEPGADYPRITEQHGKPVPQY